MTAATGDTPGRDTPTRSDVLPAVAATLELLGAVFSAPGTDRRARAAELLGDPSFAHPRLATLAGSLQAFADADAVALDVEYVRLFLHGLPATAHPYESFYRTGLLMDAACLDGLAALFAAAGVAPAAGPTPPDHIRVELEFLALLLRGLSTSWRNREAVGAVGRIARELVEAHLVPFASAFRARLAASRPAPYFATAADALSHALAAADAEVRSADPEAQDR
jgi:TorA maturation chaperone TorD